VNCRGCFALLSVGLVLAFNALASPAPQNHPIIGIWKISLGPTGCVETTEFKADGTIHVDSAASRNVSEFEIEDDPAGDGHYLLKITLELPLSNRTGRGLIAADELTR
jgi:hypothetical protein